MAKPKFNFVPERQLTEEFSEYSPARVTILVTNYNGQTNVTMRFSADTIKIYDLSDKLIRLYGDKQNRTIGWSILEDQMALPDLDGAHKLKLYGNGVIQLGVAKLLKSMGIRLTKTLSNLEVKKYTSPLHANEIYYIEIPEEESPYKEILTGNSQDGSIEA
jgi:hypothetical protein